jgi:hypothetical protein
MSLNLSATRTSNALAIRFKKLLVRIYVALDESQRQRAAQMIHRYRHLIPDYDEKSNERKTSSAKGRCRVAAKRNVDNRSRQQCNTRELQQKFLLRPF